MLSLRDPVPRVELRGARLTLALLNFCDEELLQIFIRQPELRRLVHRLVGVPAIHDHALHEPHPGGSSTARSMNERRLHARRGNRLQERVDNCGIRLTRAERNVVVRNARGLGSGLRCLDFGTLLGREAEIDNRRVSHFLDFRDRAGSDGARTRHGRFDLGEVPDARNLLLHDLRTRRGRHQAAADGEQCKPRSPPLHAAPPLTGAYHSSTTDVLSYCPWLVTAMTPGVWSPGAEAATVAGDADVPVVVRGTSTITGEGTIV